MFTVSSQTPAGKLQRGLDEIRARRPDLFSDQGLTLSLVPNEGGGSLGYQVKVDQTGAEIQYARPIDAFRALGRLAGKCVDGGRPEGFEESTEFTMLGAMFDLSRNGVLNLPAFKDILCNLALMGINAVGLYCEDTYEIPGEPFFGYLRGAYSYEELKELDDFADALGIELFPCIQTLGHLEQILQWPAYQDLQDTPAVILAEHEKSYQLIEKMIDAASRPFRSKRIHVGMDEAHGIGLGNYRRKIGDKSPFEILNSHLARVREMCLSRGLRPMIWSDMYFRLGSKNNDYYDRDTVISQEVIDRIPSEVDLVYWDYYHIDAEFYEDWIERHRSLGSEPVVASGVWTWDRFWTAYEFTETSVDACMRACKNKGVKEVFVTLWGDDGAECEIFSSLPGMQYFAEHGYQDQVEPKALHSHYRGACEGEFANWILGSELDHVQGRIDPYKTRSNPSKWLLWEDPILGHLTPEVAGEPLKDHYRGLASRLWEASKAEGDCQALARAAQTAHVLSLKFGLRERIAKAYQSKDLAAIQQFTEQEIPTLIAEIEKLWERHRKRWMRCNKVFGWESIEHRYSGLVFRYRTFIQRLQDWSTGALESIPELETDLQVVSQGNAGADGLPIFRYPRAKTPSMWK